MKTPLKLILAAAAFALAPAAALAQAAPAPPRRAGARPPQTPTDAISANSQAAPAQPEEMSPPAAARSRPTRSVLASSPARTAPDADGRPADRRDGLPAAGDPDRRGGARGSTTAADADHHGHLALRPAACCSTSWSATAAAPIRCRRGPPTTPLLEVVWTLVPVLILVAIAVPSIRLLAHQYAPPKADLTVKATGNQWYWTYTYPDHGDFEIVSNGLKRRRRQGARRAAAARGRRADGGAGRARR